MKIVRYVCMETEHKLVVQQQTNNATQKQINLMVRIQKYLYHGLEQIQMVIIFFLTQKGYQGFHNIRLEVFIKRRKD